MIKVNGQSLGKIMLGSTEVNRVLAGTNPVYGFRQITDDAEAYEKVVPDEAFKWATLDKVGAKTVVWNQLQPNTRTVTSGGVSYQYNNGALTISATGETRGTKTYWLTKSSAENINFKAGNKYFVCGVDTLPLASAYIPNTGETKTINVGGKDQIVTMDIDRDIYLQIMIPDSLDLSSPIVCKPQIFDLTIMFGETVANSLTVKDCQEIFSADYYPYSEPTLVSFEPDAVVSRGRNLFCVERYRGQTIAINGMTIAFSDDGSSIVLDGTSTGNIRIPIFGDGTIDGSRFPYASGVYTFTRSDAGIVNIYVDNRENPTAAGGSSATTTECNEGVTYCYIRISYGITCANKRIDLGLFKGETAMSYTPYRASSTTDLSSLVSKYFPDGMKSAGAVHDEIDLKRGVTVQRTRTWIKLNGANISILDSSGSILLNGSTPGMKVNTKNIVCDRFVHKEDAPDVGTIITLGTNKIVVNLGSITLEEARQYFIDNPTMFIYELAEPIETHISPEDLVDLRTLQVESGGTLTFLNNQSNDYHMPLPNQETFNIFER